VTAPPTKVRVRFSKAGKIRFLSHRDLARVWERSLRRAGVRLAYSEGFSPRPKISFGLALSTGYESRGEYLDLTLAEGVDLDLDGLAQLVDPALPTGMAVQAAVPLPPGSESLQAAVTSCTWLIELPGVDEATAGERIDAALAAAELPITVERKGTETTTDVRPGILAVSVAPEHLHPPHPAGSPADRATWLVAELVTHPRSLRPAELLRAIDPDWVEGRVIRTHQWTLVDGARCEPIPLAQEAGEVVELAGATSAPHAGARAS
jgi:radical SAM-linked protein